MTFQALFPQTKPVIAMLHLKGSMDFPMLDRAKREIEIYLQNGVEAVMVENYFGSADDCEAVLRYLQDQRFPLCYGVNILSDHRLAFQLSKAYGAAMIQIDSVCGHLPPDKDLLLGDELTALEKDSGAVVLGGVRFKYQPIRSGRTLSEDLRIGSGRCGAVVVTGEGTGLETPLQKVKEFRDVLKAFPLIIGAGMTPEALKAATPLADGFIVGSWFKENHQDYGDVCPEYVKTFMEQKRSCETAAEE